MRVVLHPVDAAPVLRQVPPGVRRRLKAGLRALAEDPTGLSNGLDVKRLDTDAGAPVYRLRLGEWRVAFSIERALIVTRIFHRSEGYGWLADLD